MANQSLFKSIVGKLLPKSDARNEAGGKAFAYTPQHALAHYAVTGCLNSTFYASAETQLAKVIELAGAVSPEFIAKTAVYCRTRGQMKDMPALLCATLATPSPRLSSTRKVGLTRRAGDSTPIVVSGPDQSS